MNELKANVYAILERCVEQGIDGGIQKAHKYTDKPGEEYIREQIKHYIMLNICEMFKFDEV